VTTVAYWQVLGTDLLGDPPMLDAVHRAAEGELRLAASRIGADPVGEPRRVVVDLYRVEDEDENGDPRVHLEPAHWLRIVGLEVPDRPDAVLVRWEQDAERRPIVPLPRRG
jgi:hypothetical protein